jgi:hypothetical protein
MEFPKCSDMKNRSNESLSFCLRFHWSSVDCLLTYMIASVFFSIRSYKAQRIQSCISFLKELWLLDRLSTSIFPIVKKVVFNVAGRISLSPIFIYNIYKDECCE